jgi:hypothetical protein
MGVGRHASSRLLGKHDYGTCMQNRAQEHEREPYIMSRCKAHVDTVHITAIASAKGILQERGRACTN